MATKRIMSPEGRLRFIAAFEGKLNFNGDGKEKSVVVLIPKTASVKQLTDAWTACAQEEFIGKIPGGLRKILGGQKPVLKDGDEIYATKDEDKQDMYKEYQGCWVFQPACEERFKLTIRNADNTDIFDPAELYDGCYGRAFISLEVFSSKKWGAQCKVKLLGIQKTRDGEALGGGTTTPMSDDEANKFFGGGVQTEDLDNL